VAEGFVEPQGSIPLQHIGYGYFEDLVNLSFFQEHRGHYVIHDLMHDMAQLVSKEECFILKNESDLKNVPENVRHLLILKSSIKSSGLRILCKYKKLRTLLCDKGLMGNTPDSMIEQWFSELRSLRVIRCASIKELPESIRNLKHLRYLEICRGGNFYRFPSSFCTLYNLQILYARQCEFEILPSGFSKLISLQKFESTVRGMEVDAAKWEEGIRFIENFNEIIGHLVIYNLGAISKNRAAEMELRKRSYLNTLTLRWSSTRCSEHNEIEVCQALHPPVSVKSVHLDGYPGKHLPSWFPGSSGPEDMSFPDIPAVTVDNNNGAVFSSLTEVSIKGCQNLTSLELLLQPAYVPAIRNIKIEDCASVRSVGINSVGDSTSLEELEVESCPNLTHLLSPSLAIMRLYHCDHMASIELQKWSLPALRKLVIYSCGSLTSIRESKQTSTDRSHGWASNGTGKFPLLTDLYVHCQKLETLDDLLTQEYLPAIKKISFVDCDLLSLPTERFGAFHFLEDLSIYDCPRLKWQSGIGLLPCSLKLLKLHDCGDFSVLIPGCLQDLTSLETLDMRSCKGIVSVPGDLWGNLKSLQTLMIRNFPDLVSIGGPTAIANINEVLIDHCWKLKEIEQPLRRGFR
jgi:Leucine-rich repeat (LRR) protein